MQIPLDIPCAPCLNATELAPAVTYLSGTAVCAGHSLVDSKGAGYNHRALAQKAYEAWCAAAMEGNDMVARAQHGRVATSVLLFLGTLE